MSDLWAVGAGSSARSVLSSSALCRRFGACSAPGEEYRLHQMRRQKLRRIGSGYHTSGNRTKNPKNARSSARGLHYHSGLRARMKGADDENQTLCLELLFRKGAVLKRRFFISGKGTNSCSIGNQIGNKFRFNLGAAKF